MGKNWIFLLLFCGGFSWASAGQIDTNRLIPVYALPGQGADARLFDSIILSQPYVLIVLEYGTPKKGASLRQFAQSLLPNIDTTQPFVLLGTSLGGMLCVELSDLVQPTHTIIISSAKTALELPFRYRFQKKIPLYKLFPGFILRGGAKLLQPIVEPDRRNHKKTFKDMLRKKEGVYMKRTVGLIIQWERTSQPNDVIHIHGTKDHTLPIRKIEQVDYVIESGSHMMTLTKAKEINQILEQILRAEN